MTGKTLSVGMIGTSWWADAMHLPALASHPQVKIAAICGRNTSTARTMADRWEIPQVFADYNEMIEKGALDAVIISTPNDTHYPITMKALENGIHVLCEKPIALNYGQARRMAEAARASGLKHLVPFTYSYMPTARHIKELLESGYIGRPYHLNLRYYSSYARDGKYAWRFNLAQAGAGVVGDLGSHFLYLAEWFFGPVKSLMCQLGHIVPREATTPNGQPYEVGDDMAIITLEFENGSYGVVHVTAAAHEDTPFGQSHHMELHGSEGTLYSTTDWDRIQVVKGSRVGEGMLRELPIPDSIWGSVRRDNVQDTYKDVFRKEDWMIRQFINGILHNTAISPTLEDGARVQRLIDAAVQSHTTGRRVEIASIQG